MQSFVTHIISFLFIALRENDYEPVFDLHDEIITKKPVEMN
jgi:hypothetical protein